MPTYRAISPPYSDAELDAALGRLAERHAYDTALLRDIHAIGDRVWAFEINYMEGAQIDAEVAGELATLAGIAHVVHHGKPCDECTTHAAIRAMKGAEPPLGGSGRSQREPDA